MSAPSFIAARRSGDRVILTVQHQDGSFHQLRLKVSRGAGAVVYNCQARLMGFKRRDAAGSKRFQVDFYLRVHSHDAAMLMQLFDDPDTHLMEDVQAVQHPQAAD